MPTYDPIILDNRLTERGYRSVTISVAPGRRVTVTVASNSATEEQAAAAALATVTQLPGLGEVKA